VKFNPSIAPFVDYLLPKMPTLEQIVSLKEDESTLKLCKTCEIFIAEKMNSVVFSIIVMSEKIATTRNMYLMLIGVVLTHE